MSQNPNLYTTLGCFDGHWVEVSFAIAFRFGTEKPLEYGQIVAVFWFFDIGKDNIGQVAFLITFLGVLFSTGYSLESRLYMIDNI